MKKLIYILVAMFALYGCRNNSTIPNPVWNGTDTIATDSLELDTVIAGVFYDDYPQTDIMLPSSTEYDSIVFSDTTKELLHHVNVVKYIGGSDKARKTINKEIICRVDKDTVTKRVDVMSSIRGYHAHFLAEAKRGEYLYSAYTHRELIGVAYENEKFVTLGELGYESYGGAHGTPWKRYFTVDKVTGRLLGWNDIIRKEQRGKLAYIVCEAILTQYDKGRDVGLYISRESLKDGISDEYLPDDAPALTDKGLLFTYAANEIGAYCAGLPECLIPAIKVKDCLTDYAKSLLGVK